MIMLQFISSICFWEVTWTIDIPVANVTWEHLGCTHDWRKVQTIKSLGGRTELQGQSMGSHLAVTDDTPNDMFILRNWGNPSYDLLKFRSV